MKKLLLAVVGCLVFSQLLNAPLVAMDRRHKEHASDEETARNGAAGGQGRKVVTWVEVSKRNEQQNDGCCACCGQHIQYTCDCLKCVFLSVVGCCGVTADACQGFCKGLCEDCCKRETHDHAGRV